MTTKEGKNFTVPKGDIVATSPTFAHRLEHVFKDADAYDPSRFTGDRKEDKAQPFSYIGALPPAPPSVLKRTARLCRFGLVWVIRSTAKSTRWRVIGGPG